MNDSIPIHRSLKSGRLCPRTAGVAALCVFVLAIFSDSAVPAGQDDQPMPAAFQSDSKDAGSLAQNSEDRFDDAPYGIDPIVTGPVSAAFKKQQEALHCAQAVWPNIPAACYPD
jgi:hypothetical protein